MNILFQTETNALQMRLQSFYSAVLANSKLDTYKPLATFSTKANKYFVLVQNLSYKSEQSKTHFAPRLVFRWEQ